LLGRSAAGARDAKARRIMQHRFNQRRFNAVSLGGFRQQAWSRLGAQEHRIL
jgi:hypothetical protein